MSTEQQMEERLWDYVDGRCSADERSVIGRLTAENVEWQRKYRELLEIQQLMKSSELESPSLRFTKNVMEEIAKHQVAPATSSYINKNIIRSIGAFFGIMILGLLVYVFAHVNWTDQSSSGFIPSLGQLESLNKVNWGRFFNNTYVNIFLFINVLTGLVFLDMYLQRRKNARHKAA